MKYIVAKISMSDLVRAYKVEAIETFTLTKMGIKKEKAQTKTRYHVDDCGVSTIVESKDVIKEADTIEELCDCIVYDCLPKPHQDAYHKHEVGDVESLKWNRKPERFENIFGAVWTERGLTYIAKLNKEGDLELI